MKLRPEQLAGHLKGSRLAPVYVVHGDEPLAAREAIDAIRAAARVGGHDERQCLFVEPQFDWSSLTAAAASLSLFGGKRLVELRMPNGRPGEEGAGALKRYAEHPPDDALLLVSCGKLESSALKSQWLSALERIGVVVQVWPVTARELPGWIERRLRAAGLRPSREAVTLLAERVEGNLLAADQEIEKLRILLGEGELDARRLLTVVGDSARYTIFDLTDAALEGRTERVARVLEVLRGEGMEPVLVLWALHREAQLLERLANDVAQGQAPAAALARQRVWERRKPLLQRALSRLSAADCRALLAGCSRADRVIKGAEPGRPWDELLDLSLRLAAPGGGAHLTLRR